MAIQLNGGLSLAPRQTRRIDGRSYTAPLIIEEPATKERIAEVRKTYISPELNILDSPPSVRLQSPIPLPIISQFPYIEFDGTTPTGFGIVPIQELLTLEPEPEEIIIYPSPFIPIEPEIGEDVPEEWEESLYEELGETPGTPAPITQPINLDFQLPDLGGWLGGIGDMLKGALPWIIIIGGGYLLLRKR